MLLLFSSSFIYSVLLKNVKKVLPTKNRLKKKKKKKKNEESLFINRFVMHALLNIQQLMLIDFAHNLIFISQFQILTIITNHIITHLRLHSQIHYTERFPLFSRCRSTHSKCRTGKFLIHPFGNLIKNHLVSSALRINCLWSLICHNRIVRTTPFTILDMPAFLAVLINILPELHQFCPCFGFLQIIKARIGCNIA